MMNRYRFLRSFGLASGALFLSPEIHAADTPYAFAERLAKANGEEDFWKRVREQFTYPNDYIYLNTGGIGAAPKAVLEMVEKTMRAVEISPRPGHDEAEWLNVKKTCAQFLGPACDPDELALTNSATEGINIILNGLRLKPGDEVITSSHEHVALELPLLNHQKLSGIVVKVFEPDLRNDYGNISRIEKLVTRRTKLIFHSHVTCTTGQLMPVEQIGSLARSKGIWYAIDGAQSMGNMPIDLRSLKVDFFAACGHKWMLGPKRTGVLYVSRESLPSLHPITVGAYSNVSHNLERREIKLKETAAKFEYGTQNESLFRGLETAGQFLAAIGLHKIHEHNRALAEKFCQGLSGMQHVELVSPAEKASRTSMITFRMKNKPSQATANLLSGMKRIRVRYVSEAGLNGIRVSFHVYNQDFEVDRLLAEIAGLG